MNRLKAFWAANSMTLWPLVAIAATGSAFVYIKQRIDARNRRDSKIDEMVDESFPASDAPAY